LRPQLVAALDIGSSKTAVVIAEVSGDSPHRTQVKILGVGQARTTGIRREMVTDIEATTDSVRKAVQEAELMAGVKVERLYVGIAGEHIHAWPSTGVVAVTRTPAGDGEIRSGDVDRVHEVARAVVVPADRELIHAIPQEYIVDSQNGIRDPVGMAGTRLEAEVFIVTGSGPAAQNIRKAVSRAGYEVAELVLEPLASSLAVMSEDEKEIGTVLVELGGGTTDVAIFYERKVRHLASLPWGGATVTNDIAKGLSLPYAEAGRAKERFGAARADLVDPNETFEVAAAAAGQTRHIARELLAHIIEQRMDEIFGSSPPSWRGAGWPRAGRRHRADRGRSVAARHRGAGRAELRGARAHRRSRGGSRRPCGFGAAPQICICRRTRTVWIPPTHLGIPRRERARQRLRKRRHQVDERLAHGLLLTVQPLDRACPKDMTSTSLPRAWRTRG
jgi:cell division protein FtsA